MKKINKILASALLFIFAFSFSAYAMDLSALSDMPQERVRLGIMSFTSKAYGVPDGMAAGISDFFARLLFRADGIMLVERERLDDIARELRLGMSGLVDPKSAAEIGKLAGAEYMLLGSITNLAKAHSGGAIPTFGLPIISGIGVNQEKVRADLDIRVVKVETGEIVHTENASGEASKSDTALATQYFSFENSEFDGIESTAILAATAKLAPGIQKALTGHDTLTSLIASEAKKFGLKQAKSSKKDKSEEKEKKSSRRRKKVKEPEPEAEVEPAETPSENPAEVQTSSVENVESENETPSSPAVSAASVPEPAPEPEQNNNFENYSTDPGKVIPTYNLPSGEKNTLRVRHLNLRQYGKSKKAYNEFTKLYEEFNGDYLAAYKAGETAQALRDNENAEYWYDKALEINPDYEPAQKAKEKLSKSPAKSSSKKRRK